MSTVFDLAAQLGQALKDDERLIKLKAAREAYDASEELQGLIAEYNAQQAAIEQATYAEEIDTHLIDVLQALRQAEDIQTAAAQAVENVKRECGYLFYTAPGFAPGTGAVQLGAEEEPQTLAGALKEKFAKA